MSIDDLWYKNAIIYCLDVEKYQDANGDGIGDFEGLSRRLDYLSGLGRHLRLAAAVLPVAQPRQRLRRRRLLRRPRQARVARRLRQLHAARRRARHPRHRRPRRQPHLDRLAVVPAGARRSRSRTFRDWYVWADERPKNHKDGIVFPGQQTTTWTLDRRAGQYYFHRFYEHQADLNTWNPYVRAEIQKIMGFWLQLGVSGLPAWTRCPFLIEKKGAGRRAPDGLQPAEGDARLPAVALGRGHHAGRSERAAGREPATTSATRATGCR